MARIIIRRIRDEDPGPAICSRVNIIDAVPFAAVAAGAVGQPCLDPDSPPPWGVCQDDPLQPDLTEPLQWIGEMVQLGVVMVNVSMGNPYASPHVVRPFEYPPPDGYETPEHPLIGVDRHFRLTEAVQRRFPDLTVVGSGYSYLQEFLFAAGAFNRRAGRVTVVGVGRAALPQPDFVRQLMDHGRLDRRRICRTFSYCTALMRSKHNALGQFATGCPPFDKETYGPIWDEARATRPDAS